MPTYKVVVKKSARKELSKLPIQANNKIIIAIKALAHDPRPSGSKKLIGEELWRIRTGDYRVIYSVFNDVLIVEVLTIGHRKDVYRK